jgi:hypothetical protein
MAQIVIEGSITPCVELSRGERVEVEHTDHVQNLIDGGFVTVVDDEESGGRKSGRRRRSHKSDQSGDGGSDTPES